jgi:hypothetical protein
MPLVLSGRDNPTTKGASSCGNTSLIWSEWRALHSF